MVGALSTIGPDASLEADASLAPLSQIAAGKSVLSDTSKCGYSTLLRLKHPFQSTGVSSSATQAAFTAFTWLYPLLATTLYVAILYTASYPAFFLLQLAVTNSNVGPGGLW